MHYILSLRRTPYCLILLRFNRRSPLAATGAHGAVVAHMEFDHLPPWMMRFAEEFLDTAGYRLDMHAQGAVPGLEHAPPAAMLDLRDEMSRQCLHPKHELRRLPIRFRMH